MIQSKKRSFQEACLNIAVGCGVSLLAQIIVFPWFGIFVPISTDIYITLVFTVISLVRSYLLRRWFARNDFKSVTTAIPNN